MVKKFNIQSKFSGYIFVYILLAAMIVLPLMVKGFVIFQITMLLVYAIAILGLNLLMGFNGQISIGHSAFYALGAYMTAILTEQSGMHYLLAIPSAGLICFVFGFLFGLPALRLERVYLALATFALALATPQILKLSPLEHWTGGVAGIVMTKPEAPFGLPLSSDNWLYYLVLLVTVILTLLASNLINSRSGRAILAIRENPIAAQTMGINNALYKTLIFGISGLYTGIGGSLGAIIVQFVSPDSFTLHLAISLLIGVVVGGLGWIPGAFIGGVVILFAPNVAELVSKDLSGAFYGLMLILLIYIMPSGAGGFYNATMSWVSRALDRRG